MVAEVEAAPASVWPLWDKAGIRLHEHKLLQEEVHLFTLEAMVMIQVFFFYFLFFFVFVLALLVVCLFCFVCKLFFPLEDPMSNELNTS